MLTKIASDMFSASEDLLPLTIKGDLVVRNDAGANVALPVALTAGLPLRSDPASPVGMSYGNAGAVFPFVGALADYAGAAIPGGWLACNGAAVSRVTYVDLYAAIGTAWGAGDGSTTFNVPDLRSRAAVGVGAGSTAATITAPGAINAGTDVLTVPDNEWLYTGQLVTFTVGAGGAAPGGLSHGATYYVIRLSSTSIAFAASRAAAVAGTKVPISSAGTGALTITQTLTDRVLGARFGEELHTLTNTEMPVHSHTGGTDIGNQGGTDIGLEAGNTGTAGGSAAHNVVAPSAAVTKLIFAGV